MMDLTTNLEQVFTKGVTAVTLSGGDARYGTLEETAIPQEEQMSKRARKRRDRKKKAANHGRKPNA